MKTPLLSAIAFTLTAALPALVGACAAAAPEAGSAASEIGANLVTTTYYNCKTGELVGEKTQGCVVGPAAQWGVITGCYEIDSDTCETGAPLEIDYCAFGWCDPFRAPEEPELSYPEWLALHR